MRRWPEPSAFMTQIEMPKPLSPPRGLRQPLSGQVERVRRENAIRVPSGEYCGWLSQPRFGPVVSSVCGELPSTGATPIPVRDSSGAVKSKATVVPSGETPGNPSKPSENVIWRLAVPSGAIDQMWTFGVQSASKKSREPSAFHSGCSAKQPSRQASGSGAESRVVS